VSNDSAGRDGAAPRAGTAGAGVATDRNRTAASFDAFLEELAAAFVRVPAPDVDSEIERWLRRIVEFFDADRSSLAQVTPDGFLVTHSWARPGYELTTGIREQALPWVAAKFRRGETFSFSSLDELPHEAAEERSVLAQLGLKAHVSIPLMVSGTVIGALAIGCIRHSRPWRAEILQRLRLMGMVFGNALARKRAVQEYVQLSRALTHAGRVAAMGQLASSFAHEINQPLGASLTNAQTALRLLDAPQPDLVEVRAALEDIAADNRRAGEIVRELRRFLRKHEPNLSKVAVRELLEAVVRFVSPEARGKEVEVAIDLTDRLPDVMGDRVQIQQVLVNLLLNAFDALAAMPAGQRRVLIAATEAPPGRVAISVSDCGAGVPESLRSQLFEPFVTTKPDGLGIGLAIAQTIVTAHGGRLEHRERAEGGAVFAFALAVAE
jgi:signal transduction histidine kinase